MVENHYEFIVTYENRFYFSTSERTCPSTQPDKAKRLYKDLCERFPESDAEKMLSKLIWREIYKACHYEVKNFRREC